MVAREGELRLAQSSVALAKRAGWLTRGDWPKPLLVGITIDATRISNPRVACLLARSYAELDCDGYWVQLAHLTENAPADRVAAAATFLFALQGLSGRRVFGVDCKNLTWPLLAAGLSGVHRRDRPRAVQRTRGVRPHVKQGPAHRFSPDPDA
jgi:hypothetical protein